MKRFRLPAPGLPASLRGFRKAEDGAVTIPAVFWLPVFIMIMVASVELCVLTLKQTLLERGVDLSARILRLGIADLPSHDELKRSICNNIAFISNCMEDLAVEVYPVDKTTWTSAKTGQAVLCADGIDPGKVDPTVEGGLGNEVMILRACLQVTPMENLNPLSRALVKNANGQYALVVTTAFVNEPK